MNVFTNRGLMNEVLLEHTHAQQFMYRLWRPPHYNIAE